MTTLTLTATQWAFAQRAGAAPARALLLAIAHHVETEGSCTLSQAQLGVAAEMSENAVVRWLGRLEEAGLITRCRRHHPNGARATDLTMLNMNGGQR